MIARLMESVGVCNTDCDGDSNGNSDGDFDEG